MLAGRSIMRMRWRHLLFAHWPVEVSALRPLVPGELEIDEYDGRAWVGLIPFTMEDVTPRFLPRVPWRGVTDFHECNVRTYVYPQGQKSDAAARGVWFFSLDAASRLAVWGARTFFRLPYFHARMNLHREGDVIDYRVERRDPRSPAAGMTCRWRALEAMPPSRPGELAHFLTERYCLYAMKRGQLHRSRIEHAPWPLRRAELLSLDDSLVRSAGIEVNPSREPVLHHADVLDVRARWLERV
jgi:uncharacterized protein YqjF (DUF2071 family)